MMAPEVEKLARQTSGTALIVKVDTDAVPELGERFGIRSIPVAVFKNGQVVARESGAQAGRRPASAPDTAPKTFALKALALGPLP